MAFAVFLLSPVISTTSIPMLCSVCTARAASCLTVSAIAIIPHNTPAQIKTSSVRESCGRQGGGKRTGLPLHHTVAACEITHSGQYWHTSAAFSRSLLFIICLFQIKQWALLIFRDQEDGEKMRVAFKQALLLCFMVWTNTMVAQRKCCYLCRGQMLKPLVQEQAYRVWFYVP